MKSILLNVIWDEQFPTVANKFNVLCTFYLEDSVDAFDRKWLNSHSFVGTSKENLSQIPLQVKWFSCRRSHSEKEARLTIRRSRPNRPAIGARMEPKNPIWLRTTCTENEGAQERACLRVRIRCQVTPNCSKFQSESPWSVRVLPGIPKPTHRRHTTTHGQGKDLTSLRYISTLNIPRFYLSYLFSYSFSKTGQIRYPTSQCQAHAIFHKPLILTHMI